MFAAMLPHMQVAKPRSAKVFEMQLLPASERTCPWKFATIQSPFLQLFTLPQVSGFHQGLFANHSSFVGGSLWFLRGRCHWLIWLSCLWLYQKLSTLFGIQITSTMRQPSWSCPSVLSDTGSMSLGRFLPRATLSYAWFWILRTEKLRKQVVWPRTLTVVQSWKTTIHDQVRCMRCGTLGHPNCGVPPKAPDAPTQPVPPKLRCWTDVSKSSHRSRQANIKSARHGPCRCCLQERRQRSSNFCNKSLQAW